jgi:protein involved in polysaccharide export with SLBB domain
MSVRKKRLLPNLASIKLSLPTGLLIWMAFMLFITNQISVAADFSSSSSAINPASSATSSSNPQAVSTVQPSSTILIPQINSLSGALPGQSIPPVQSVNPQIATTVQPPLLKNFDYSVNLKSNVFGSQLFTGSFAKQGVTQFNPDYMITIGDQLQVRLWGGYVFDSLLTVDPQGNIFLPQVGPIKVLGVHNQNLQSLVESAVRRVFRANVFSYASLAKAHPVRVFVGGFVNRPGLYYGTSMDSLLHYLDQAGGIDAERGSFLNVQIKRGKQIRATLNLYDFLLQGRIPLIQLADGDVIFTSPRQNTTLVSGLATNTKRFEFQSKTLTIAQLSRLAKPSTSATHVRIVRNLGVIKNIEYYPLAQANNVEINNGDEIEFTADKKPGTITVRIEGEHQSPQEYVLPYGAHMGDLLRQIKFSERSDTSSIQLYRQSMIERQKASLAISLKKLEANVLTARSDTSEEASLRKDEADLILQWIERAKTIEPKGQVLIAQAENRDDLLLENADVIKVPPRDGLVLVSGEVLFPNTIAYDHELSVEDYINLAGGYSQNADDSKIIILHRDGSFDDGSKISELRAGDGIMVMPKIDVKSFQIAKELLQILFQIGIAASVVLLL